MWLLLLLIPLLLLLKKIIKFKGQNLPPSPPQLPIIGNLHQLGALPHQSFITFSKKYGPVMLFKVGRIPFVIINSAEAAREVLKVHDIDSCSRAQLTGTRKLSYNFLDIAFAPYGDYWKQMRKICVLELFSLKRAQSFRFIREEEVGSLINSISQSALSSSAIDRLNGYHTKLEKTFHDLDNFFEKAIEDHRQPERAIDQDQEDIIDFMLKLEKDQTKSGEAQITEDNIKAVLMVSSFFSTVV
ncbi:hypothetical protein Q3G72_033601 [Acer saccharum]|nr:hypothetical protein Q3G72_033601 [Acer saccharum]